MRKKIRWFSLFAVAGSLLAAQSAHCMVISVLGAGSFGSGSGNEGVKSPSLLAGGELTFGIESLIELGGFYDHGFLDPGSQSFYGGVVRLSPFDIWGLFVDGKFGLTNEPGLSSSFGYGIGVGKRFSLAPLVSLAPRVGYRSLPVSINGTSLTRTTIDVGLLLSIGF